MYWLVVYDICDEKRLRKTARILQAYGMRVQRSVFELSAPRETMEMIRKRIHLIIEDPDSIVYIPLCMYDFAGKMGFGKHLFDSNEEIDEKTVIL